MFANHISKPTVAISSLGLVGVLLTGCGAEQPDRTNSPQDAANSLAADAAPFVEDPWVRRSITEHRAESPLHDSWEGRLPHDRRPREATDSPCFMNPDHWDVYVKDGALVCIAKR
jgi:hypothetical protein